MRVAHKLMLIFFLEGNDKIASGVYKSEQVCKNVQSLLGQHRGDHELLFLEREYQGSVGKWIDFVN